MTRIPTKLKPWFEARRRFKLSHAHTQMARELGMNPRKLGSLAGGGREPWKLPLPDFIVECYRKSFGRSEPEHVRSLEEVVQAEEKRRKEKQARKAEKMVIPAGSSQLAVQTDGLASASQRQTRSRTLASARDTRTMRFHANHVSSSVSGDYYQAMFEAEEDTNDPNSPYLLIQRQFETSDGGRCGSVATLGMKAAGCDNRMNQASIPNIPTIRRWSRPIFAPAPLQHAWPLRMI
jgi:hypothetical protein